MVTKEDIDKAFPEWDSYKGDERVQKSTGGFFKLKDGETATIRIASTPYRYYTIKEANEKMPMRDKEAADLIDNRGIDDLIEDQSLTIGERYAFVVYNRTTKEAQLWLGISQTVFDQIATLNREAKDDGGIMAHDISVTRKGSGTDTKYTVSFKLKSEEFTDEQNAQCLDQQVLRVVPHAVSMA